MSAEAAYISAIRGMQRADLLGLWNQIEARDTPGWEPGKALEYLVLRAFELEGARVQWPYRVIIDGEEVEQIDGAMYVGSLAAVCEMKDHRDPVAVEAIAKMRNQLLRRPAGTLGLLFSKGGFTAPARTLTRFLAPQTILLWEGAEISYALARRRMVQGLRLKYEYAVEHGIPDKNIRGVK